MIELKNISKTYQIGTVGVHALRNVSLKIMPGEFVAIMGPSGSGKSTLLHILGFLDRPDSGSYYLGGKEITSYTNDELAVLRNRIAGFVFQQFHLLSRVSALTNAELPLIYAGRHDLKDKALEKIKQVGLAERAQHQPNELSGGEQQRVAIARALVNEPLIIFADEPTGNLDTKTEHEIMAILKELNHQGKTIIMVTHEREIGEHAQRVINMRDGEIISDERLQKLPVNNTITEEDVSSLLTKEHLRGSGANFWDHLKQAVNSMVGHKMRSILSMLGILIGVAAVIAMLALGSGASASIQKSLASLGSNLLMIMPGGHQQGFVSLGAGSVTRFTTQDEEDVAKLQEVKNATANVRGRGQIVYQNKNWSTQILGTGVNYPTMRAAVPAAGRFFTDDEIMVRQKVALLGNTVVTQLFGDASPIGATIKINRIYFTVIGILPTKGAGGFQDQDDIVVIPFTTAMYRVLGKEYIDYIDAEVKDASLMDQAQDSIKELIIQRHHLGKDSEDSFQIRNMNDIQQTVESTTKTLSMLLGSIAAISLLVGGIGIMNIMLVSVRERTREIGLRKAIGARSKDILMQFLIEAVVMTFSGGIIGVLVGAGIALAFSSIAGWATKLSTFSIVLACGFSILVGVGFGLWPAKQAAKLDPIEALRYE